MIRAAKVRRITSVRYSPPKTESAQSSASAGFAPEWLDPEFLDRERATRPLRPPLPYAGHHLRREEIIGHGVEHGRERYITSRRAFCAPRRCRGERCSSPTRHRSGHEWA